MTKLFVRSILLGAAALPACAAGKQGTWTEVSSADGLQVAVGDCIIATGEDNKSLFGAIALTGITKGVNMLGRAISNAGAEKTWQATAFRNFDVPVDAFPKCVQVVRGKFTTGATANTWSLPGWGEGADKKLAANGIRLTESPTFLLEAQFVQSQVNKGGVALRPVQVSFTGPIGTRALRGDKSREIAVFASITPPGTKPTLANAPGATLAIGKMAPFTYSKYADPADKMSSPYESAWFSVSKEDLKKPLTITVMLSETQGADAFLTFLGSVISDKPVQDALVKEASVLVIPEIREQAEITKLEADTKADSSQELEFANTQAKVAICAASKTPTADAATAIEALNKYLMADRKSPKPHGRVTTQIIAKIDTQASGEAIKAACAGVLAEIKAS